MTAEFANQVAVVTGAARGLGLAVATLLAKRGATVVMVDRDETALKLAANALRSSGYAIDGVAADVTDEIAVGALAADVQRDHGGLDVLINNAGGWRYGDIREISNADWDWTFAVNLKSVQRFAEPVELAYAVAFLASPEADFITGQVLSPNGGQMIV